MTNYKAKGKWTSINYTYEGYLNLINNTRNRQNKYLCYATYIRKLDHINCDNPTLALQLHNKDILHITKDSIIFKNVNWYYTQLTRSRIAKFAPIYKVNIRQNQTGHISVDVSRSERKVQDLFLYSSNSDYQYSYTKGFTPNLFYNLVSNKYERLDFLKEWNRQYLLANPIYEGLEVKFNGNNNTYPSLNLMRKLQEELIPTLLSTKRTSKYLECCYGIELSSLKKIKINLKTNYCITLSQEEEEVIDKYLAASRTKNPSMLWLVIDLDHNNVYDYLKNVSSLISA